MAKLLFKTITFFKGFHVDDGKRFFEAVESWATGSGGAGGGRLLGLICRMLRPTRRLFHLSGNCSRCIVAQKPAFYHAFARCFLR